MIVPKDYVGAVMELCNDRRGRFDHMEYPSTDRVLLIYELPLGEIVLDFYDQLKSRTRGYASFDYDLAGFRDGHLVRVDVLVAGEQVDALSLIVHRDFAYERGKLLVEKLREEIPRQMFDVADPGGDRLARDRPRDDQGEAQGRAREVLRRRHLAEAQAAREAEEGQEADEAGRRGRGAAGGVPGGAQPRQLEEVRKEPAGVTWDEVAAIGLELPGVEVGSAYGTPALRVKGSFMCRVREDGDDARDPLRPGRAAAPVGAHECLFVTPHYEAWPMVLVALPRADPALVRELVEDAWVEKAPKKLVDAFVAARGGGGG